MSLTTCIPSDGYATAGKLVLNSFYNHMVNKALDSIPWNRPWYRGLHDHNDLCLKNLTIPQIAGDTVIAIAILATSRLHSKYLQHKTLQIHKPIINLWVLMDNCAFLPLVIRRVNGERITPQSMEHFLYLCLVKKNTNIAITRGTVTYESNKYCL